MKSTVAFLALVSVLIVSSSFVVGLHLLSLMGANQVQRMYDLSKQEMRQLHRHLEESELDRG